MSKMAIHTIHKQAILKLITYFTVEDTDPEQTVKFSKEPSIDLSLFTRLGFIISKFEKNFCPNKLLINGNVASASQETALKFNNQNLLYFQQISIFTEYIENSNVFKVNKSENFLESIQQHPSSQHFQMLILLIRDWLLQYYLNKNFIYELFPSTSNSETITFSLADLKENSLLIISLLIFNIFYKLRNSLPKYRMLLDFSWICFADLEPFICLANLDNDHIFNLLQTCLLSARIEDECDSQINANWYKQIEELRNKIFDSKKRIQNLTQNKQLQSKTINDQVSKNATRKSNASSKHYSKAHAAIMDRPFKCEVCTKTFPTSYKLNRHTYSHSGERPYMCNWPNCFKRFNDNYHLRRHMNTHTGEKPFPCKYTGCAKRYSRSEDLRNHQKSHFSSDSSLSMSESICNLNSAASSIHHTDASSILASPNPVFPPNKRLDHGGGGGQASTSVDHHTTGQLLQSQLNQIQQHLQLSQSMGQQSFNSNISEDSPLQPAIILQEVSSPGANQNSLHLNEGFF